ncbi:uncharacterized protein LOC109827513 isoform X2 [Asparagus officinalis]|uniref:uncharacterized protein LOC109827513 isoform X2 n=1 Tax=Asparagus officinalis TaxID=4686 RepID=UPI00098E2AC3|nr:uncharacterized protein LOC109827513 isoform X2 [Asparagus officinalis]
MDWYKISHSHLNLHGLNLHIAHIGEGELGNVVFLHGFPEIWYSWRHQMMAVAEAGYRAIAMDFRGFGLSDGPQELEKASWDDLIDDLVAVLDSLTIPKAFIVGKDFGAKPAFDFAIQHPDRVSGIITVGVPFAPKSFSTVREPPKGFYITRWREPGRAEADFARFDTKTVLQNIYILFSGSELPVAGDGHEIMDLVDPLTPLPQWLSEKDLQVYTDLYEKSGFVAPMQIPYRSFHNMKEVANPKVEAPALLIMGEKDYIFKFSGMDEYVRNGEVKEFVPDLEIVYIPEGTHFVQEQFPDQVNQLIIRFINNIVSGRKFSSGV